MMKDDDMTDEALLQLKTLKTVAPSPEARKVALNAAMAAFDAAQVRKPAASGWLNRWKLSAGLGVPLGTAVAALVLLPLGTQMYSATSHRVDGPVTIDGVVTADGSIGTSAGDDETMTLARDSGLAGKDKTAVAEQAATLSTDTGKPDSRAALAPAAPEPVDGPALAERGLATIAPLTEEAPPEMDQMVVAQPAPMVAGRQAMSKIAAPSGVNVAAMPGVAGGTVVPIQPPDDNFAKFDENRVKVTAEEPVSTFSIDVDTASYSYVRSLLKDGYLPEPEAVRLEELINYFPYDYPSPASLATPFKSTMTVIPTPWNPKTELLEIGIKGYVPPATERKPENLTFLIDTSGSMDEPNKLPLLKRSFGLLVDTLKPDDTVSIVVYAGSAGVVLEPTKASNRTKILAALDQLEAGGSTAGAEGIALAYSVASEARTAEGISRVILATDGDFNVGIDSPDELKTYIKTQRDKGISLSVLGFGRGNLDDALMQALAQNGNGNASYIDSFSEAQKVLVEEGGANMVTIAKDVKIQVEFNPAVVAEYRLIGYETRALNREDFNNDAVDAGEIGAGHTVTALYEVTPVGSGATLNDPLRYSSETPVAVQSSEIGFLKMRYKAPDGDVSKLIETPIGTDLMVDDIAKAGNDQRFAAAVAAFGQKLKQSNYGDALTWQQIIDLANGAKGADVHGYRAEFVQMVNLAKVLNPDPAAPAEPPRPE
jgi:Ca-activated chloride channel family protein